jgi:hypothetical protein
LSTPLMPAPPTTHLLSSYVATTAASSSAVMRRPGSETFSPGPPGPLLEGPTSLPTLPSGPCCHTVTPRDVTGSVREEATGSVSFGAGGIVGTGGSASGHHATDVTMMESDDYSSMAGDVGSHASGSATATSKSIPVPVISAAGPTRGGCRFRRHLFNAPTSREWRGGDKGDGGQAHGATAGGPNDTSAYTVAPSSSGVPLASMDDDSPIHVSALSVPTPCPLFGVLMAGGNSDASYGNTGTQKPAGDGDFGPRDVNMVSAASPSTAFSLSPPSLSAVYPGGPPTVMKYNPPASGPPTVIAAVSSVDALATGRLGGSCGTSPYSSSGAATTSSDDAGGPPNSFLSDLNVCGSL